MNYRKLYKQYHGSIPVDQEGRSYDIHHIDGNHANNAPENLKAVTLKEHYDIHYKKGDYGACQKIALRMKISPKERSEIARKSNLKRVQNGTNPFLGPEINKKYTRERNLKRVAAGTHNLLGPTVTQKRIANGTHNMFMIVFCPHCGQKGTHPNMIRWHFDNCKKLNKQAIL